MKKLSILIAAIFVFFSGARPAMAWNNPTSNPAMGQGVIYAEAGTPASSFYIKSNGNVGIGTTNPTDLLYVNAVANSGNGINIGGVFKLRNSVSSNHFVLEHLAATGDLYIRSDSDGAGVDTGNIVINDQGGNVGIANNNPTEKLDVTGNIKASGTITATSFSGGLSGTVSAANVSVGTFGANTGGGNYIFPANLTVGSPTGTLTANGNITALGGDFISNTTGAQGYPDLRLQGAGTEVIARNDGGRLWLMTATTGSMRVNISDAYDNDRGLSLTYAPGTPAVSPTGTFDIGQTQKNHATYYSHGITRLYTNGVERLRIDADGDVGIGSTAPTDKLEVVTSGTNFPASFFGSSHGGIRINAGSASGEANVWLTNSGDAADSYVLRRGNAGSFYLGYYNGIPTYATDPSAIHLAVNKTGEVGVGVTTPTAGLDVRKAITAATGTAIGTNLQQTLTAAANNDVLTALKINPTFVPGAYTGVTQYAIDATGTIKATSFEGGLSGTVNAGNVSMGTFGSNTGYGNYTFKESALPNHPILHVDAANGRVGIGTATPVGKLDIRWPTDWPDAQAVVFNTVSQNPSMRLYRPTGTGTNSNLWYFRAGGSYTDSLEIIPGTSTAIGADTLASSPAIAVRGGGNVGIGLAAPTSKLEISAGSLRVPASGYEGAGQIQSTGTVRIANSGSAQELYVKQLSATDSWSDADTNKVTNGVYSKGGFLSKTTNGQVFFKGQQVGVGYAYGSGIFQAVTDNLTGSSNTYFQGVTGATTNFSVRADGQGYFAGNVGIGASSPTQKLDVRGLGYFYNAASSSRVEINGDTGQWSYVRLSTGGTVQWDIAENSTSYSSALQFRASASNPSVVFEKDNPATPTLYVKSGGNIGIGTTSPSQKLDVNGGAKLLTLNQGAGANERFYPNVISSAQDTTVAGAWIINTPIPRASNQMFRIRVHGYAYGNQDSIDFTIVGYPYSGATGSVDGLGGAIVNYDLQDSGTDGLKKYVGVNSAGNLAIALGDETLSAYYYRISVDAWVTRTTTDYSTGWSVTQSAVAGFGFLDIKGPLTSSLKNNVFITSTGNVGIGTASPTTKLEVSGTVKATAFEGPLSGTISAGNVSSGTFGSNTGGGNYIFPARLGIGNVTIPNFDLEFGNGSDRVIAITNIDSANGKNLTIRAGGVGAASGNGGNLILQGGGGNGGARGNVYVVGGGAGSGGGNVVLAHDGTNPIGSVGIGLASPSTNLDIYGGNANLIKITRNSVSNANIQYSNGTYNMYAGLNPAGNFGIGTSLDLTSAPFVVTSGGSVGIGAPTPSTTLDVNGVINAATGYRVAGAATTGYYLRGNGTNFVASQIQASDIPSGTVDASTLVREDNRQISPSELTAGRLKFGFTAYNNNNASPWADFLHLRSYTDSSGGSDNLLVFNKNSGMGMRLYQQAWGSATAYSTYKDVVLAENTPTANYLTKYSGTGVNVSVANSSIYDNGNIGIGSSSPAAKLVVNGNVLLGNADADQGYSLMWRGRGDLGIDEDAYSLVIGAPEGIRINLDSNNNTTGTNFEIAKDINTKTGGTVLFMVRESDGYVGIAKTNPATALDVNGTVTATSFSGALAGTVTAANVSSGNFGANTGGGNYTFPANVGVGMAVAPGARLDVLYNSTGVTTANNKVVAANTTGATFDTTAAALTNYNGYFTNTSTRSAGTNDLTNVGLFVSASGAQKNYAAIFDQGSVGIGQTSPLFKLHVGSGGAATARLGDASTDTVEIGAGAGKLNVGTIDPLYTIGGKRYATFTPAMTGVKEETSGTINLENKDGVYYAELSIKSAEEGSDLWLLYQTTDFGKDWDDLAILLSPSFEGGAWYEKDPIGKTIRIYGRPATSALSFGAPMEVSYRLTAPRFDHEKWGNRSTDLSEGFKLDVKE